MQCAGCRRSSGGGAAGPIDVDMGKKTSALIEGLSCGQFLADRAFDANWLREALDAAEIEAVIPPKSNHRFPADFDLDTYKWRHLIENLFGKLKEYRGIVMRCSKTDTSYGAFGAIAANIMRLRYASTDPKKQNC